MAPILETSNTSTLPQCCQSFGFKVDHVQYLTGDEFGVTGCADGYPARRAIVREVPHSIPHSALKANDKNQFQARTRQ